MANILKNMFENDKAELKRTAKIADKMLVVSNS